MSEIIHDAFAQNIERINYETRNNNKDKILWAEKNYQIIARDVNTNEEIIIAEYEGLKEDGTKVTFEEFTTEVRRAIN